MPIQDKDLGKYKRPSIYIEEIDASIVETPAQNVLINLVPGFSKKGPVNKPVYVDNKVDFESIFGSVDKQLENKGSYFHRTVNKMLETGPVWALNLLTTVPNRDTLNYVSVSTSSKYNNSDFTNQFKVDYDRFFNRQDFWERDSESFLDVVNDPTEDKEHLLHFTNMGDKTITVFAFKSTTTGFDISASSWYEGDINVPLYMHPKSLISDYIVDILIISGDWSDYKTLSVDTTWSKYFTTEGLISSKIQDFVNETGVVSLANYDVSLIPNFKDLDLKDMYIENIINNDTDKTGLFCTYNEDMLLDSDYLTNYVDMIGDTIVGTQTESINFLSYNQSIKEVKNYPNVSSDSENNTFNISNNFNYPGSVFETNWVNWKTYDIELGEYLGTDYIINFEGGDYVINGVQYSINDEVITLVDVPDGSKRLDVIYLDSDGIHVMNGINTTIANNTVKREITFSNENTIILGTVETTNDGGSISGTYTGITVDVNGYINPTIEATSVNSSQDYVKLEFLNTLGSTIKDNEYAKLRLYKIFNEAATNIQLNKGIIISANGDKKTPISDPTIISYTTTTNSQLWVYIENGIPNEYINSGDVLIYYKDKSFNITDGNEIITSTTETLNVVSKYSDFYVDFVNGEINNGDYFMQDDIAISLTMYLDDNETLTVKLSDEYTGTGGFDVFSDIGNWRQTLEIEEVGEITDTTNTNSIKINKDRYSEIKRGDYIEAYYDVEYYSGPVGEGYINGDTIPRKLTRVINIKNDPSNSDLKIIYTDSPIKINTIDGVSELYTTVYPPVHKYVTNLKAITLTPFKIHIDSIPNGTETRLNTILDSLAINTSLYKGLVNRNKISWRYLVDSFGLGLSENSKQQYVDLCGKKLNSIGFINMPSAKSFKKSSNPSFVNDDGSLSIEYIKNGANEEKNPDFLYSFGTGSGRSTVGYFFPYVKVTENGVSRFVPPAADVATAYMQKHTSNVAGVYEWTIVAGVNMGIMSTISGTEIDFSDDDLDDLSDMGANPITFIRNVGYIINDENTAQVFPISSLSYLHSREVLIELENELYAMLLRYQWKFNTATVRSEIKYRADRICQRFVDSSALYTYKNTIDTSNNTAYIIDLQGGVLDTHVEIVKGMGWIVNNITIEKTGTINSTGFTQ